MSLTFTDVFCGAGGSSLGLREAGFELKLAANHWDRAIETHAANFTDAEHVCADVSNYDMRRFPGTHLGWFSPICTENSPAGGRRRRPKGQLDMFEETGHVAGAGFERTRATFHDVIRATEVHRYAAVIVENVVEAADWELWDWWLSGMVQLGYNYQFVSVSSAHIGGDGNPYAPQWRDRLYIVFTRKGIRLPDVEPRPRAWCYACETVVEAYQAWKRPERPKIGKYGRQYVYCCPSTECGHAVAEPFVLPAATAIDWTDLGPRIGDRKKTPAKPEGLAPATMARIRAGLEMFAPAALVRLTGKDPEASAYVRARPAGEAPFGTITTTRDEGVATTPFLVAAGGNTWERPGSGYVRAWPVTEPLGARSGTPGDALVLPVGGNNHSDLPTTAGEPFRTRMVRDTDALVTSPFITMLRGPANAPRSAGEPLAAMTTGRNHGLTTPPFITVLRNNQNAMGVDEPLTTVATSGAHHGLTTPDAFYVKNYGGYCEPERTVAPVMTPFGTITATGGNHALVIPYRGKRGRPSTTAEPLHTLATHDSAALLQPDAEEIAQCRFRMLKPREHLRAQRFPDAYVVTGNQGEQTMQAGNAVSANVAHWLGRAIAAVL